MRKLEKKYITVRIETDLIEKLKKTGTIGETYSDAIRRLLEKEVK